MPTMTICYWNGCTEPIALASKWCEWHGAVICDLPMDERPAAERKRTVNRLKELSRDQLETYCDSIIAQVAAERDLRGG